jgi:hypothetical protein
VLGLERMTNTQLEQVFMRGATPSPGALAGWEFRGLNSPKWFRLLGIRKFFKGFFNDGGELWGYNCPAEQTPLTAPWIAKPSDSAPKRFGFFQVKPVDAIARDNRYLHALLIDYGLGNNPRFDPSAGLRDYLVQVEHNNPDLFLGKAYYAVGPARVPMFSYFILERYRRGPAAIIR